MKILIALSGIVADICLILLMKALFGHVGMVSALVVLLILWVGNITPETGFFNFSQTQKGV